MINVHLMKKQKAPKPVHKKKWTTSPLFVVLFVLLIAYCLCITVPIIWGLLQSVRDPEALYSPIPWPFEFHFDNYINAFNYFYVPVVGSEVTTYPTLIYMFGYSLAYALGAALFGTFVPCVVGYLTARFDNPFSRIINVFVVVALALPIVGSLPSELQMAKNLHLYDTIFGVWFLKGHFLSLYYLVFYARFKSLSSAYEEAARIDGANYFAIFFRIMLPLVSSMFLTVFLLQFIAFWNDYYTPLMFMPSYPTVAYGMFYFNNSAETALSSIPMKIAGCMLMLIPILILFLIFNKRLMVNMNVGGVKE